MNKFIIAGDLHCREEWPEVRRNRIQRIIERLRTDPNITCVICPGDLTTSGKDGSSFMCWQYGGTFNQLKMLQDEIVIPIEKHTPIYLCAGNHDTYIKHPRLFKKPVFTYIKEKHGNLRYQFKMDKLRFVCLHIYPDAESIVFLTKVFQEHPDDTYVLFFHYNPVGQYSDWWSIEDKQRLLSSIYGYDILCLLVGHAHMSGLMFWDDEVRKKKYLVVYGSGDKYSLCTYLEEPSVTGLSVNVEYL